MSKPTYILPVTDQTTTRDDHEQAVQDVADALHGDIQGRATQDALDDEVVARADAISVEEAARSAGDVNAVQSSIETVRIESDFASIDEPDVIPILADASGAPLLSASKDGNLHLPFVSDFHKIGDSADVSGVLSENEFPIAAVDRNGSSVWHWVIDFSTLQAVPAYCFVDMNNIVFQAWNNEGRTVIGGAGPSGEGAVRYVTLDQFGVDENTTGSISNELQAAMDFLDAAGGGELYIENGVYTLATTVYIPSNVTITGQSTEGTILRASTGHTFDTLTLLDYEGTPDNQKVVAMLATKHAADDGSDQIVRHVRLRDLTIDWNEAPAGGVSSMGPLVMCRIDGGLIERCHFVNTLDGSLKDDTEAELRGAGLIFGFAENVNINDCVLHEGDYYTVRTNLLSRNLVFDRCFFDVDKPLTMRRQRHIIEANRPTPLSEELLARFGDDQTRDIYINRCRALVNNVNDYFSSHASTGLFVTNCVMEAREGPTNDGQMVLRAHDGARDVFFMDNLVDMTKAVNANVVLSAASIVDTVNAIVKSNICLYRADSISNTIARGVIVLGSENNPVTGAIASDNMIRVTHYEDRPIRMIWAAGAGISINGNAVVLADPLEAITDSGPRIVQIDDASGAGDIAINGNTARGEYSQANGLTIDENVPRVVESGNNIASS